MTAIRNAYLALCATLAVTYFVIDPSPTSKLFLYNGVAALSVIAVSIGIKFGKPAYRTPWLLFLAGLSSFLTADVLYYLLERSSDSVPFPSIADAFYLGMYPLVVFGLALLVRNTTKGRKDWAGVIDASIFGIALFSVLWVLVMDSYVPASGQRPFERMIALSYPVADLAVLFVAIRLAVTAHRRTRSLVLIVCSLTSLVIADTQYGLLNAANAFKTGGTVDAFWLGFYVLFGLAALDPTMSKLSEVGVNQLERLSRARLSLMFLATLTVPTIDLLWGNQTDRVVTLVSAAVLFALMLGRVVGLVRSVEYGRELLRREARHDPLTGLANRTLFGEKTAAALAASRRNVAVLLIDLDDFKAVNDSLGHAAGDQILVIAAERISRSVRDNDLVARLGGDEFAVLLTNSIDSQDAAGTASRILRALDEPAEVMERSVRLGGSVGIALQIPEADDVQNILRRADVAMYSAKREGKGRFEFFEQSHYDEVVDRIILKTDLEGALARDEFEIVFQPIIETDTAMIRSVEALLRWNHPKRGRISPNMFIPLAEESGTIKEIGGWVLLQTCKQVREWQTTIPHCSELRASVNLSARQLEDTQLLHRLTEALRISGLAPNSLMLEVTESLLVSASTRNTRVLEQLTALRVRIAIDDFGTGYSSLSYLHSFPVDTIKIDQSFVQKLDDTVTSRALVRTVIDLARAVGGTTVAEGVANQRQLDILAELNCDLVQGFYFSRPLAAQACADFLLRRNASNELLPLPAKTRRSIGSDTPSVVEILRGIREVEPLLAALDLFHRDVGAPVTARWPWLSSWFNLHPDSELRLMIVRSNGSEVIDAAAILAVTQVGSRTKVFTVSEQSATVASIFARDEASADRLAAGIADFVLELSNGWELDIQQVHAKNPAAEALDRYIPALSVESTLPIPQVKFTPGMTTGLALSKNMRKQLKRGTAKLDADCPGWHIKFVSSTDEIMALLPDVEETHVERDHDRRNESDLDNALSRRFWQETIVAHSYTGELELAALMIDDAVASYVLSFVDGDTYRVFDGRMNSRYAKYSPGRILEAATLDRALTDPRFDCFDWMTGVAPETILAVNDWEQRVRLRATGTDTSLGGVTANSRGHRLPTITPTGDAYESDTTLAGTRR
jgi:diguanylate cyclase